MAIKKKEKNKQDKSATITKCRTLLKLENIKDKNLIRVTENK